MRVSTACLKFNRVHLARGGVAEQQRQCTRRIPAEQRWVRIPPQLLQKLMCQLLKERERRTH
jgi:hypothetical protein